MTEEFGSTIDDYSGNSLKPRFRRTEFMDLSAGEHRFRLLEPMETKKYTHYLGFAYLECLGDECPVCENNRKILYEHPEDYREVKGWSPRSQRFYINVFDKTNAKVCPKCGVEKINYSQETCPECGTALPDAAPLNKVKVLSMGAKLLEDLKVQSKAVRTKEDERVDIRLYDWTAEVKGAKTSKTIGVAHRWYPGDEAIQDVGNQELFNLEEATIKLSREEMLDVFNGASLRDVFAMRKAKKQVQDSDFLSPESAKDVEESIQGLFEG